MKPLRNLALFFYLLCNSILSKNRLAQAKKMW
jgi:hypothetical protein